MKSLEFFLRGFSPASAVFLRRLTPLLRVDYGVCSAFPGFLFCTRSVPRLGFIFYTRSMPRLGRFLKGGYAPPFGAQGSNVAAERLESDVLSGSVEECEAVDRAGLGDAVVVHRVD